MADLTYLGRKAVDIYYFEKISRQPLLLSGERTFWRNAVTKFVPMEVFLVVVARLFAQRVEFVEHACVEG